MILKLFSQIALFSSFVFIAIFFYRQSRKVETNTYPFLHLSLGCLFAGFLLGSETWINFAIYTVTGLVAFFAAKYISKKGSTIGSKALKIFISLTCLIAGFLIMMQPENFLQGNAGNLTFFSLLLLSIFVSISGACFCCYTFSYFRDKKWLPARKKILSGEVYLLYSSMLIAAAALIFLMFTESVPALFLIFLSCLLFMVVLYVFALESTRDIIYSKVELLFGTQFIMVGLLLASTPSLLLGSLWIAYKLKDTNFHEFREILYQRLHIEKVICIFTDCKTRVKNIKLRKPKKEVK